MLAWSTLALVLVGCVAGTDEEPEHPRLLPVVGAESLREGISGHDGPVLVDYWARACPPCLRLAPVLRELVEEREDLLVLKVDMGALREPRGVLARESRAPDRDLPGGAEGPGVRGFPVGGGAAGVDRIEWRVSPVGGSTA
jgi:hypothetical protein